ncbi:hypothetical protein D3C86_1818780 [compost metagenome]
MSLFPHYICNVFNFQFFFPNVILDLLSIQASYTITQKLPGSSYHITFCIYITNSSVLFIVAMVLELYHFFSLRLNLLTSIKCPKLIKSQLGMIHNMCNIIYCIVAYRNFP